MVERGAIAPEHRRLDGGVQHVARHVLPAPPLGAPPGAARLEALLQAHHARAHCPSRWRRDRGCSDRSHHPWPRRGAVVAAGARGFDRRALRCGSAPHRGANGLHDLPGPEQLLPDPRARDPGRPADLRCVRVRHPEHRRGLEPAGQRRRRDPEVLPRGLRERRVVGAARHWEEGPQGGGPLGDARLPGHPHPHHRLRLQGERQRRLQVRNARHPHGHQHRAIGVRAPNWQVCAVDGPGAVPREAQP
mmetsp:Transcript_26308/g.83416  ORF Transcript_26308/g.83416 Transcript_26308/m.83416 type:complete len:247 (+) Transcript_26308:220-960(+)